MSKNLLEKLNEISGNKYSYLKLTSIDVNIKNKSVTVFYIYPESHSKSIKEDTNEIIALTEKILATDAKVIVKLTVSHFDESFFKRDFMNYLNKYPAILTSTEPNDLIINDALSPKEVKMFLCEHIFNYCADKKIEKEISEYLEANYCDEIKFELILKDIEDDIQIIAENSAPTLILENDNGRYITPQNVDDLIGRIIYDKATYIEDAIRAKDEMVVCGRLTKFDGFDMKMRENEKERRKFYRMTLEDFTGSIECLYFPTKYTKDKITLLQVGKEIITRGSLEQDKRNETALMYIIKDISYCTLPKDFVLNRIKRTVEPNYRCVIPKEYISTKQASLFDLTNTPKYTKSLLGKTYCVFDIETTGLSPKENQIIEISAVKIVDGVFKETFSSLVNPKIPIPPRITDLTNICDNDVYDMPEIDDVLIDFYKFSENCTLVAQNIQFDYSFITEKGKPLNLYFDNEKLDTLYLSRKYFPGLKKYKLEFLCDYFGVKLDGAHRALNDATATAEIFVKLLEKMDNFT